MTAYDVLEMMYGFVLTTGIFELSWKLVFMWGVGGFFLYLGIAKNYEPLLLLPIGFGIFIVNFPNVPLMGMNEHGVRNLIEIFYHYGLEWTVMPCIVFLGLGALTDFGPLIANPKMLLVGAGAQLGVFVTFTGTVLAGFTLKEAASVGIIGGAEGPTTIYLTQILAPQLLGRERARGLFVHGHGAAHSAADHEVDDFKTGKNNTYETVETRFSD